MKYDISQISLIGAGLLGSRHLQGLAKINKDTSITVLDPNTEALKLAKKRFEEMPPNSHIQSVNYLFSQQNLKKELDLVIIATNADVRRKIIEELLNRVQIRHLLFEKVVFQSVHDFEDIIRMLAKKGVKTWVNCPRRIVPFFKKLREETIKTDLLKINVRGNNWGLASNTIHMLDLLAFLSGQTDISIDISNLDQKIFKSKRTKFIELGGRLNAKTVRGDTLELIDEKDDEISFNNISIEFNGKRLEIVLQQQMLRTFTKNREEPFESTLKMPLQSEMTAGIAEQILETGQSDLTTLDESFLLHRPMLNGFNKHLSMLLNSPIYYCPIT